MKNQAIDLVPVIEKESHTIETRVVNLLVNDEASLKQASDIIRNAKDLYAKLDEDKKRFTEPAKKIIDEAKRRYDPILTYLESVEGRVKEIAKNYLVEKQKKAAEETERLAGRVERGTMKAETAVRKIDEIDTSKTVRTESSGLRMIEQREVKVEDLESLAGEDLEDLAEGGYIQWNMTKVRKDVLAGEEVVGAYVTKKQVMQSF